ncbi:MAG: peptidoglycan editing factor PgeF [Deltaproteobacteria bacterium]|nr:peptidoglycan editing factor PgeF [Deltaproteobacteria bacterium]
MKFITSPAISRHRAVTHAFLTRIGGVSTGPFASLNFNENDSDDVSAVAENRAKTGRLLRFDADMLFTVRQVHGDRVLVIDNATDISSLLHKGVRPEADAILTSKKGLAIGVLTADCVPIILADPVKKVIGIVHAGWRGTIAGICGKAVTNMRDHFGSHIEDISAAIGPSIGPCCYEVGEEVAASFLTGSFREKVVVANSNGGRGKLDLRKAAKLLLLESGVEEGNISVSPLCTSCNTDLFFSYRREGTPTGRQLSFVVMNAPIKRESEESP